MASYRENTVRNARYFVRVEASDGGGEGDCRIRRLGLG